jgi:predicted restriction endonuclease
MAKNWTEHELLIAMNLYCKLPFGKLNHRNKLIIQVAEKMGRTPSSLSMKLCNFASFDPALQARGIKGLQGASQADRKMWAAFASGWDTMSEQSEAAYEELMGSTSKLQLPEVRQIPDGPSEVERTVRTRRLQIFFRNTVLASYEFKCAVTGVTVPKLLIASHIIPWSKGESRRADPTNGLCLNALYDRAFDGGLITFDEEFRMVVSEMLKKDQPPEFQQINFLKQEGRALILPHRFHPDNSAMQHHREIIFIP